MPNLFVRVLSAVAAAAVLFSTELWFGSRGLIYLSLVILAVAITEYSRIAFHAFNSLTLRAGFSIVATALLTITVLSPPWDLQAWGFITTIYLTIVLWSLQSHDNNKVLQALSLIALGFVACALLPGLAIRTLMLPQGSYLFFSLLCIVFFGDIFAYFGGRAIGGKRFMPTVSPKKTWSGSISGMIGSMLAGLVAGIFLLKSLPLWYLLPMSLLVGFCAQNGDLFVSLLKRVAGVKDSGKIMPGHGGILDRIDGVLFAGPVFYAAIDWGYSLAVSI